MPNRSDKFDELREKRTHMEPAKWDSSDEAWTTTVECPAYGAIDVVIKTDGEMSPPSEKQLAAVALIAGLQQSARKTIREDVKRYAKEYLGEEELEDFESEDFDVVFDFALIPNLRAPRNAYFFLSGESDIDMEHGIACLCKDGEVFRVCHTDLMYANYPRDDPATFDELLRGG